MSVNTTNAPSFFGGFGATISAAFTYLIENGSMAQAAEARAREISDLEAKTDEELAEMNLQREHIVHYVFRDLMHL
ncbi:MAG: hypothetical protein ABJP03_06720 [Lentilitoribacter sp.]